MNSLIDHLKLDSPLITDNFPIPDNTILGISTVRRSIRLANKKRINYGDLLFDDEKIKSKKRTVRDTLKMEISPIRQLKNLTIEARHTLSLQESKKKRLQFENSLFLPNNKKRKDVLKTYFNKKSSILKNTKEIPNTSFLNFNELNELPALNQSSQDFNLSLESSKQSYKSPMKRNRVVDKEKCNDELAACEEIETVSSTEEMAFPSYVSFRTKLNKLMLVKSKIVQESTEPNTVLEEQSNSTTFEHQECKKSLSVAEEPESTTKSDGNENPLFLNNNSAEQNPDVCTRIIRKSVSFPDTFIGDGTQKSESIQRSTEFTRSPSSSVRSPFEVITIDSSKCKTLVNQSASMSVMNISPCLPSNYSNSMEFLMQSTESNESTASSSDCLKTTSVETTNLIHNSEIKEYTPSRITDSLKTDGPTGVETNYLIKATSPIPLGVMVINEKLPITSKLIQDAEVQSTSTPKTLHLNNETVKTPKPDTLTISTSITKDNQLLPTIPNIECCPYSNCTEVSSNHQEASNEQAFNQPSSQNQVVNSHCRIQPHSQRNFKIVSQQIVVDENIALKSLDDVAPFTKMQKMPNRSRYFKPFYLKKPEVFEAETTRLTSTSNSPSAEQQHAYMHIANERHLREHLNPSSSTQNITNINAQFFQTRTPLEAYEKTLHYSYSQTYNNQIAPTQQILSQSPGHASEQNNHKQKSTKTLQATPMAPSLPYSYPHAYNSQIGSTQQILSQSPGHASEQNNHRQKSAKTLQATPMAPSLPYCYPQAYNSQIGAPQQILSQSLAHASEQNNYVHKSIKPNSKTSYATPTQPFFHNHPHYNPSYASSVSSDSTNQQRFSPFPAVQQQNNTHSNYVSNKNSPLSHSPIANPNIYGYPPTFLGNPNQSFNGQSYFPSLHSAQYSSANQTGVRTEQKASYDSRNIQPHSTVNNNIIRHHPNYQNTYWGQHKPVAEPPSHPQPSLKRQRTVDPNKWMNDRFQHIIKNPHLDSKNNKSTCLARPQVPIAPVSTSPEDMNNWMRARTQQAATPPELTTEQRITQLEVVVNSFNEFVNNFQSFKSSLVGSDSVNPLPTHPPVAIKTPPPWQTMTNNSPIIGNITTQPVPDARIAWAQYNNLRGTMQMAGNIGNPGNNSSAENSMKMEGNPVNQYPVPRNNSHQINAADSTTGGNYNSCLDLRSFRPTQHYNQSYPHNTLQFYKNPYTFFTR